MLHDVDPKAKVDYKLFQERQPKAAASLRVQVEARPNKIVYIAYFAAIACAEALTVFVSPLWGTVCHIAVLAALIVHSALSRVQTQQRFFLSLALAPLVRIVSLSMPLASLPRTWWYPIVYAPLLGAAIVAMRINGYSRKQVGLSFRSIPIQLGVALAGLALGTVEYFILRPDPLISALTWQAFVLPALVFVVAVGFVEEFLFRGVMQQSAVELMGSRWGIVYVAGIFAFLHMGFYSLPDVVFVFGIALFFGWAAKKTASLAGVVLSHGLANIMLYLIAPFIFR